MIGFFIFSPFLLGKDWTITTGRVFDLFSK
jgi:hypothetical protein